MEFTIYIEEDEMTVDQQAAFADGLRRYVHGEPWSQFSATVIGGPEEGLVPA